MANEEHLAILRQGVKVWNEWRDEHRNVKVYLNRANLNGANLNGADLSGAYLTEAQLNEAQLNQAELSGAHLNEAHLRGTGLIDTNLNGVDLTLADLTVADLTGAHLTWANLNRADLSAANLSGAHLTGSVLRGANLSGADLSLTRVANAVFANLDLSAVKGLATVRHFGPSTVGTNTLYLSNGKIPDVFLRGCGVPDSLIEYLPALIGAMEPIQYYSCFISYSSQNENFAERLHGRMEQAHLRVWYAPEDMKGGQKVHEQIDQAIKLYDKLVLVLSEESIQSEWVMTEIRKARKAELRDKRRKLFPIRLVDMDTLRDWECFDADTGKDLAVEVREYHIPDFSRWKDHDSFEHAFARLLKDLQATEAPPAPVPRPVQSESAKGTGQPVSDVASVPQEQSVIEIKKRRLRLLEERQARMGHNAPPEVLMEIEDLRQEIGES